MVDFKNKLILAPMAGYSDLGLRILCERYGADITVSEMISAKAIMFGSEKTNKMLKTCGLTKTKGVQLFGNDENVFESVIRSGKLDEFDYIDLNMGCPAPKIVKNKEGSFLMKDLTKASKIISACVKSTTKPVTVKFRLGEDDEHIVCTQFAKMCEDSGAKMITIHGRTVEQKYSGTANLELIKKVVDSVKIDVCGNGDVIDKQSYENMLATGVKSVMIGRKAIGNPYIFSEILGKNYTKNLLSDIIFHYNKQCEIYSETTVLNNMKKHLAFYLKGQENFKEILPVIYKATTINKTLNILENFLKK